MDSVQVVLSFIYIFTADRNPIIKRRELWSH